MQHLRKITVIGLGLLGGSVGLAVSQSLTGVKTAGFSHRASTRAKARRLKVVDEVFDDIKASVKDADLVILATPICNFEDAFRQIADSLPAGCIVTDVGSTKLMPHHWAAKCLPKNVHYIGSHPIAGSEQRGIEFCRDDLFYRALCILTTTKNTDKPSVRIVKEFWSALGCFVKIMTPAQHDRIFADVSHLPHITAAALVNASNAEELKFAGKGFMDSSRIASGPANIWADVLMTNAQNTIRGIDRLTAELAKLKKAIRSGDRKKIEKLLDAARTKRSSLVQYKMNSKELI
ncbi:MAG: prephenate dehydrogenase/arogenate dehydrogenase family protein [Sedimentisphaerales bacterium]|jgi:prephenate dehydrogenase